MRARMVSRVERGAPGHWGVEARNARDLEAKCRRVAFTHAFFPLIKWNNTAYAFTI